jgi:hypothetical protein
MVPVGQSVIYLRPLYVAATSNPQPTLNSVVGVLGRNVYIESNLAATLSDIFKTGVSLPTSGQGSGTPALTTGGTVPAAVQADLAQAQADYKNAQAALQAQDLATYQSDIAQMETEITQAINAERSAATGGGVSSGTTTTTAPKVKAKPKSSTRTTVPTSTQPKASTTTTVASAAAQR